MDIDKIVALCGALAAVKNAAALGLDQSAATCCDMAESMIAQAIRDQVMAPVSPVAQGSDARRIKSELCVMREREFVAPINKVLELPHHV